MLYVTWKMQEHTTAGQVTTPDDDWITDAPEARQGARTPRLLARLEVGRR